MRKPWKKLSANGRTWLVYWRKDLEIDEDGALDGATLCEDRIILLESRLRDDKEELADTLVHELLHAAYYSECVPDLDEADHTKVARTLAQLLGPFLKKL